MPRPIAPFSPFGYDEFQADQQRQARERRSAADPVAQSISRIRQSEVQRNMLMAGDPDKTAQTNVLARRVGEPPAMIAGREGAVRQYNNIAGFSSVLETNPGMMTFYINNPGYLAASQDDAKPQGLVAGAWDWISKIPSSLKEGWYALEGQGARINWALASDVWGPLIDFSHFIGGGDTKERRQKRQADRDSYWKSGVIAADSKRDSARPNYTGAIQEGILGGFASIPQMATAVAVGVATRSPGAAAFMMGGSVGGAAYADARLAGKDVGSSLRYGYIQGATEALTELAPQSRLLGAMASRTGVFKTVANYLAAELPGEMTATLVQSYSEFLTLHPEQTVSDWVAALPRAQAMTVLGVLGGGSVFAGAMRGTVAIADKVTSMREARANGLGIEQLGEAALQSKLRKRDPEAYGELLKHLAEGAGSSQTFVPAEVLASYMQSDSYDPFNDPMERYRDDIEEALATGGDIAIPTEFALGTLPGTPAWGALKNEMRLSAGGMSVSEADAFNAEMADLIQQQAEEADVAEQQRIASMEPITKVYDAVFSQAREAGYNVRTAGAYAELWSARYEARAARNPALGSAFDAYQASNVSIQQVMPEAVAAYAKADNLDVLIHAMKKAKDGKETRESLLEWIARRGGVEDRGGDLTSMDADKWHKGKPFRKRLLKAFNDKQVSMLAGGASDRHSLEATFDAAISAGFFPDLYAQRENGSTYAESIDVRDFLSAISGELRGSPIYAEDMGGNPEQERMAQAVDELRQILSEHGVDPDKATKAQVTEALKAFADEQMNADRSYQQGDTAFEVWAGVPRDQVISSADAMTHYFKTGEKIAVEAYHGTARPDRVGGHFRADRATAGPMAYFTSDPVLASSYAEGKADTSIDSEDYNYENWFKLRNGDGTPVSLPKAWDSLSASDRVNIRKLAPRIKLDDETGEKIELGPESNTRGNGGYYLRGRMNPLEALTEAWLTSGSLFDQEERFVEVLKLAGVPTKSLVFEDPHAKASSVYPVFIAMRNPLVSKDIPAKVIEALQAAAAANPEQSANRYALGWDKNDVSLADWVDDYLTSDMTEYAWTRIPDAVTDVFRSFGYDGLVDWSGKGIGPTGSSENAPVYIPFSETQVKSQFNSGAFDSSDPRILNQGERGRIDLFADGSKTIRLFESRDLSTLLHESGHLWLEEFHADAQGEGASDQLRGDFELVKAWFAANGHAIGEDGSIPVEAHELFARSMERYFLEGKAPSAALRSTFETFRSWLLRLYLTVKNALVDPKSGATYGTAPLTPEIREVFDRMLATDEAIGEAQSILRDIPMSQEDLGMTAGEYETYQKAVGAVRDDAFDALLYRTMETVRRARTVEWKAERARLRAGLIDDLAERPEFKALAAIKDGTKLSRSGVVTTLGDDAVSMLPRGSVSDDGVHPSILAESVGLPSGEELLLRMAGIKQHEDALRAKGDKRSAFDEAADLEADNQMRERHGDVLSDGSIEEEALAAIHSDTRSTVITAELNSLARRSGNVATPLKLAREWAERSVRDGRISEHATGAALARHKRNELKAARAVEKAILAGDVDEAFNQKQAQLINHERWRAAKTAKDEIDKIVRRLGKLAKAKTLKSMDQDYLDRIHDLLADYDFRQRTQRDVAERESFVDWVKGREAIGEEVHVPARLSDAKATNWSQMAYGDLAALDDTVASIAHLGRRKKQFIVDGKKRDWREVRHNWLENAEGLAERQRVDDRNQPRSCGRELFASVVRVDMMAKQMDNGDANGLMTQTLVHGASGADSVFARIHKSVLEPIVNAYMEMGSGRLFEKVTVPELAQVDPVTGDIKPGTFTRGDLLAVALNLGNESNLAKMIGGENLLLKDYEAQQWSEEKILAALGRELNEAEWKMVRLMWERVNSMWPEIAATERELTGVVPERVEPRTVQTPYGAVEGGYWPAVYDSDPVRAAAAKVDLSTYQEDDLERLFGQTGKGIGTSKGHTISRTDYVAPMLFNLEAVLFGHVQKVAKRIAYQGWATQALKVIRDPRVRAMWTRKLGKEYHAQLEPWLRDVVNQGQVANSAHLSAITGFIKQARLNMTVMGLVGRFSTMVAQVGGLTSSATAIGANNVLNGMRISASSYGENKARILDASDMMARRVNEFDRDQAAALAELMNPPQTDLGRKLKPAANVRDKWNAFGFYMIGAIQLHLVDIPTWSGAYAQAVAPKSEGGLDMEHGEAVRYSDRMVEEAQGSSRPAQLAAIQRGGEWAKIVTLFYTFFGTQLNYQWQMAQDVRNNRYGKALKTGFWVTVATPLLGALMSGWISGDLPDDENEDTWLAWIMRNVFFGMFNGIPIVRDLANQASRMAAGKYAPAAQTPWQRVAGGVGGGLAEAFAAFSQTSAYKEAEATMPFLPDPKEVSDKWIRHTVEGFGYATGTGTGQVAVTAQYGYDVATGAVHPENLNDVRLGVTTGKQ